MGTQKQALKLTRTILEPRLVAAGFFGRFPSFHRLGTHCVECVVVTAHARAGLDVYLGSVPLRTKLETRTAEQDATRFMRYPVADRARQQRLRVGGILLPAEMRALPNRLARVPALIESEGRAFWARHDADLERHARSKAITDAVASGNPARLARVLASMPRKQAQQLLDVPIHRWHERTTIMRMYRLAPELVRWKAPWMLGAILATGAVLALHDGVPAAEANRARAVLAWLKPQIRRVHRLAAQIGIFADRLVAARSDVPAAAALFELVVGTGKLGRPQYGNALFSVMSANRTKPVDRSLQQRMLRAALAHAGDDPSVRFNAACISMELGKPAHAREHLLAGLELGSRPEHVRGEPLLRPLITDPEIVRALVRPKPPRVGAPAFRTHRAARLARSALRIA